MFLITSRPPASSSDGLTKPLLKFRAADAESPAVMLAMAVMLGCALYFSVPGSSRLLPWMGAALAGAMSVIIVLSRRGQQPGRLVPVIGVIACLLAGLALGLVRSEARTAAFEGAPVIDTGERAVAVSGWLQAIDRSGSGRMRLMIAVPASADAPEYRVRVLGDPGPVTPGETIRVRAVLQPPREAVIPGGYDYAFQSYFRRLAGTGYAIAPAEPGPELNGRAPLRWARRNLARLRFAMAQRIRSHLPERSGALAAALLTGDRSGMDRSDMEALRTAGLGHLLAISGLHMALLAGGLFFGVRAGLAAITPWARRHDPARPAAWLALVAAVIYLLLSGAAIPTQRAFIMTAAMLGALLARRRALSFHTLALALILVLLLTPEAVIAPGFQMSFAAVTALMAVAQAWQAHRPPPAPLQRPGWFRQFFGGMATTSLVAGLATGGFAAFHFHRMASFGLAGNLIVMPVFTLLVMPAGIFALCLMPFGLEAVPLWVMGWGLERVLDMAHWVSSWPGALQPLRGAPGWVLLIYVMGFAGLLLGRGPWRLIGVGGVLIAALGWAFYTPPDLFISRQGVVVARSEDGADWQVSHGRRDRFAVRVFLESQGVTAPPERAPLHCDDWGCRQTVGNEAAVLIHLRNPDDWQTDCQRADLILSEMDWPQHRVRQCAARVMTPDSLERQGSALVWLQGDGRIRVRHVRSADEQRAWMRRPVLRLRD